MATTTKKKRQTKKPTPAPAPQSQRPGTDPRNGPVIEPTVSAQAPKGSPEAEPQIDGYDQPKPPSEPKGSQVAKATPNKALEGIMFDDLSAAQAAQADPRINEPGAAPEAQERSIETDQANQDAARMAIDQMKSRPIEVKREPPRLPTPTAEEVKASEPEKWLVLRAAKIARGAATYALPMGKTITNRDYDIESLRAQGVELKQVG